MALHYKGYSGTADYSAEDGVYFGHVTGIADGVTYEGETLEALEADFRGGGGHIHTNPMAKKRTTKKPMTKEELRAMMPERINKLGQWLLDHFDDGPVFEVVDMRAVMK